MTYIDVDDLIEIVEQYIVGARKRLPRITDLNYFKEILITAYFNAVYNYMLEHANEWSLTKERLHTLKGKRDKEKQFTHFKDTLNTMRNSIDKIVEKYFTESEIHWYAPPLILLLRVWNTTEENAFLDFALYESDHLKQLIIPWSDSEEDIIRGEEISVREYLDQIYGN